MTHMYNDYARLIKPDYVPVEAEPCKDQSKTSDSSNFSYLTSLGLSTSVGIPIILKYFNEPVSLHNFSYGLLEKDVITPKTDTKHFNFQGYAESAKEMCVKTHTYIKGFIGEIEPLPSLVDSIKNLIDSSRVTLEKGANFCLENQEMIGVTTLFVSIFGISNIASKKTIPNRFIRIPVSLAATIGIIYGGSYVNALYNNTDNMALQKISDVAVKTLVAYVGVQIAVPVAKSAINLAGKVLSVFQGPFIPAPKS